MIQEKLIIKICKKYWLVLILMALDLLIIMVIINIIFVEFIAATIEKNIYLKEEKLF